MGEDVSVSTPAEEYAKTIAIAIASAVGNGLTVREIVEPLLENAAATIVATASDKRQLEASVELSQHYLDKRIIHYDDLSGHSHFGGPAQL